MFNIYVLLSLVSSLILAVLILIVLRSDPHSRSHHVTALLLSIMLLWSIFDLVQRSTASEDVAYAAMMGVIAAVIFVPPVILHLSYIFPWKKRGVHPVILFLYGISFFLLAIHLNSSVFVSGVKKYGAYDAGYDLIPGKYTVHLLVYVVIAVFAALAILLVRYSSMQGEGILARMRFIIVGLGIMAILTVATGALPIFYGDFGEYPLTTLSFSIGGLVMIYGFTRPLPGMPVAEQISASRGPFPSGVETQVREKGYPRFHRLVTGGMAGICISGRKEEEVREELGLDGIPVVDAGKLLRGMKKDEARDALFFVVSDAAMDSGTVVLLDSLEKFTGRAGMRSLLEDLSRMNLKGMVIVTED